MWKCASCSEISLKFLKAIFEQILQNSSTRIYRIRHHPMLISTSTSRHDTALNRRHHITSSLIGRKCSELRVFCIKHDVCYQRGIEARRLGDIEGLASGFTRHFYRDNNHNETTATITSSDKTNTALTLLLQVCCVWFWVFIEAAKIKDKESDGCTQADSTTSGEHASWIGN